MNFDVSPFSGIRPIAFRLKPWTKPDPPKSQDNALRTVVLFARLMGLPSIPAGTSEKFKTDPYYKYCFYRLRAGSILTSKSKRWVPDRERLKAILENPCSYNDQDLYLGLRDYMNNFIYLLPGEDFRQHCHTDPSRYQAITPRVILAIDEVLGERMKEALTLSQAKRAEIGRGEEVYTMRAAHAKLSLGVFNSLVASGQFKPQELY